METKFIVALDYDREEKVWNVCVPSLPGCFTWGKTEDEALKNASDAIRCYVDMLQKEGESIPQDARLREISVLV